MVVVFYSSIIRDLIFYKQYHASNNIPCILWCFNNGKHDKQRDIRFIERVCFLFCGFFVAFLFTRPAELVGWRKQTFRLYTQGFILNAFFPDKNDIFNVTNRSKGRAAKLLEMCLYVHQCRHVLVCKCRSIWEVLKLWSKQNMWICPLAGEQSSVTLSHLVPKQTPISC